MEASLYIIDGLKSGWLRPVIGAQYSLDNAAEAHKEVLEHPKGARGKVILNIPH